MPEGSCVILGFVLNNFSEKKPSTFKDIQGRKFPQTHTSNSYTLTEKN